MELTIDTQTETDAELSGIIPAARKFFSTVSASLRINCFTKSGIMSSSFQQCRTTFEKFGGTCSFAMDTFIVFSPRHCKVLGLHTEQYGSTIGHSR